MYVNENRGKYPYYRGAADPAYNNVVGAESTGFWWAKLLPYNPLNWTNPAYHCPGYKGAIRGSMAVPGGWTHPEGSYAYNAKGVKAGTWIATNDLMTLGLGGRMAYPSHPGLAGVASEATVTAPSEMFAIGESRWKEQGSQGTEGGHDYMFCGIFRANRGFMAFDPKRHGRTYNQLFCDGHVQAMSPWILFNPTSTAAMWNYDHQPHPEFWPHG